MFLAKKNTETDSRILLIFSRRAYMRRKLYAVSEGRNRLFLPMEETGLLEDIIIMAVWGIKGWRIEEKELNEKNPFYFYTPRGEKLLLMLAPKADCLASSGRILLGQGMEIGIGNAFKNRIFYDCYSLIETCHARIFSEEKDYVICNPGQEGVYVNGQSIDGKKKLYVGDRVDLYGLHILVLKEMLVCVAFCGLCRVADEKIKERKGKQHGRQPEREEVWIERRCEQEESLHVGEVEVVLPEKTSAEQRQPLVLSLGPALTMVLPMLLMAWMGSYFMEGVGSSFYYMSVIMSGSCALLAVFWGLAGHQYAKRQKRRENREKEQQYREYLGNLESDLMTCMEENRKMLERKYPALDFLSGEQGNRPVVLWNRYYRQKEFLALRIGEGEIPFQIKVVLSNVQKRIVQGKLAEEARELAERFGVLGKAPIVADLYENRQIGLVGSLYRERRGEILLQLLVQIAACHCYTEVKTVCFYHKENIWEQEIADCMKWMSHSWSANRKVRFLAGDDKEAAEILPVLTRELTGRREEKEKGIRIPWYIIIVLNEDLIRGEGLYKYLTDSAENAPVSTVFAGMEHEDFPKSCRYFIAAGEAHGEILNLGVEQISRQKVKLEFCSAAAAQNYTRRTAGFRVREPEGGGEIPGQVSFLQLYRCSAVEELESGRRWRLARTEERIKVPIGCRMGGNIVSLDIHEKFHGPHGLIAGTTGSGKSELLQTYLLSMAVSYSPADVNFFMIDYKGGGTGNLLKTLPHCAGVISNLSGKQIKRAMSAIISENKRRQKLLSDFQVNHIDAYTGLYRKGKAKKPMPHLILVVDEFAELKKEEPEFMQEIISLAQVGRSLGVHLILATQKPAGTVDDKIWSNARFRLCLKVQDRQDSMDMLHNGDAAALTAPGQCYLQIGAHEYYELFQTGYCGGKYIKGGERKPGAVLLENTGKRKRIPEMPKNCENRSQIEVLVDYVNQTARENAYPEAQSLWLPELPQQVLVEELKKDYGQWDEKEDERDVKIVLGLCDDPENQCQFPYFYTPFAQGHLAVCGGPAVGKTALLKMILHQLVMNYGPEEVLVMAADMGQDGLECFLAMPDCLGILGKKEDRDIFFYHLERLFCRRKKILGGMGFEQYSKCRKEKLPVVFLFIDNFGAFYKILDEEQQDFIMKLAAEGLTLGIYLILSAAGPGEIGTKLYEKMKTALALEMSDRFQYGDVLRQYYIPVLPKENQKGRGLCRVQERILEFQAALALKEQEEWSYFQWIEEEGRKRESQIRSRGKVPPEKFPVLAEKPDYEMLAEHFDQKEEKLPLGYCLSTGEAYGIAIDRKSCFLISGSDRTGRSTLLSCLLEGSLRRGCRTMLFDPGKRLSKFMGREGLIYLTAHEEMERWQKLFEKPKQEKKQVLVFISDMEAMCRFIYSFGENRERRIRFWEEAAVGKGEIGFLAGIFHPERDYEAAGTVFFREFTGWQQGIHLGGNLQVNRALNFDDLSYARQSRHEPPGTGYFKEGPGKKTRRLLLPQYEGRERKQDDLSGHTGACT